MMTERRLASLLVAAAVLAGAQLLGLAAGQSPIVYFCPMHPEVTSLAAGTCGKCGMALVAGDPYDQREYRLAIALDPPAPRAGTAVRLWLKVFEPLSGAAVTAFQVVHDKLFHLFVVSQTLEHFFHLHPEPQADGSFAIELTLPEPGPYRLFADFLPVGGTPQVLDRLIVTADYAGPLAASRARLPREVPTTRSADGSTVHFELQPPRPVAGREVTLKFHLRDERTGTDVRDLEPYLGAWGHTLVLSEDTFEYVHAHPVEYLPEDRTGVYGGPDLTFNALFPRPGRYRLWMQFNRRGTVGTVPFTVEVVPP